MFEGGIAAKWLAMLKEIAPVLKRAAMIVDPNVTPVDYFFRPADAVAASLGVEVTQAWCATLARSRAS